MEKVGVIAFAFGQQKSHNAGPSNEEIGKRALEIIETESYFGNDVYLSTQWEVQSYLVDWSSAADHLVSFYGDPDTHYIDTAETLRKSLVLFRGDQVTRVILIAHPLHLFFIRLLIATKQWDVGSVKIDWSYRRELSGIPFDKSPGNIQPWTRGPIVFIAYLLKVMLTKKHGK